MIRLTPRSVPTWNAIGPGLPFPGEYPTRWWIKLTGVGVRWSYLGKPSAMAYRRLYKLLQTLRGPVVCSAAEFDRGGKIFHAKLALPAVGDPVAFLLKGQHASASWKEYHTWDQKGLEWVLTKHTLARVRTEKGIKRVYVPVEMMKRADWQENYKALYSRQRRELDFDELGNDF